MRQVLIQWTVLGSAAAIAACGAAQTETAGTVETPTASMAAAADEGAPAAERLSFADAIARARQTYADATAIEVENEDDDGQDLLEVEFLMEDGIQELYMDPHTGETVRDEAEELDDDERAGLPAFREALATSGVTLDSALELMSARYDLTAVREIELSMHEGALVITVELLADPDTEIHHDPATGEPLAAPAEPAEAATGEGG